MCCIAISPSQGALFYAIRGLTYVRPFLLGEFGKMTVLKIMEWPENVLTTKAEVVTNFDDQLKTFVKDMLETMEHSNGIGLAANQVNSLQRILVMKIPHDGARYEDQKTEEKKWWHDKTFVVINPEVVKKDGRTKYMEGCLSFPEMFDFVQRADVITVKCFDENGKEYTIEADGLLSICLQHEIDHLDGIVFTDRMSRLKATTIRKKMMKRADFAAMEKAGAEV